jgi:hypothetical protein
MYRAIAVALSLAAVVAAPVSGHPLGPAASIAATCADFPNQAAAQQAANTRDADGDGIYCEDLPCPCSTAAGGGGSGGGSSHPPPKPKPARCFTPARTQGIPFSRSRYPDIYTHYKRAIAKGWPRILTLNRKGASERRAKLLEDVPTKHGYDRDEYPPAEARGKGFDVRGINPTGWMADVMLIPSHENRSQGSVMEHELKPYCNGTKFSYRWTR